MEAKKLSFILLIFGIIIMLIAIGFALSLGKKGSNNTANNSVSKSGSTLTKEVGFAVVRVLPNGFSPKEVILSKGMVIRFTNPLDKKINLNWEGKTQYTSGQVYDRHDVTSLVFDKDGTYTFMDSEGHTGKVMVK